MKSLVDSLASLDTSEQVKVLSDLSNGEFADLFYDWAQWARPDQMPPQEAWTTGLIRAGRGWGKTRCGAEWVRQRIEAGAQRIALVGETAADVRDVMISGTCERCERTHVDMEYQHDAEEWLCVYCLEQE